SRGFAPEDGGLIQPLGREEALICWAGLLAVASLAAALVLTALHVRGMFTLEGLAALYRWVTLYV
ncbi:MAG: hypothetical protein IIA14_02970, partial [SAR324 cluster bacterium]|nr:hypothetical protein [SAR324 cluster bacterium]